MDFLFIGDSITHGWEGAGKKYWDKYYAPRKAVNMGFGDDRTQHVLWRLDHGHLEGISPKLAVLMIGTNNSNGDDNTAEEIADGIIAICKRIRTKCPKTKILILAIFFLTKDGFLTKKIMPDYLLKPWEKQKNNPLTDRTRYHHRDRYGPHILSLVRIQLAASCPERMKHALSGVEGARRVPS